MFETLGKLVANIMFADEDIKVQKYLDEATSETVLRDLSKTLRRHIQQVNHLRTTFEQFCVAGEARPSYWTLKSFESYIHSLHPTISSIEIELLWRSFHFYAYYPFPRDSTDSDVNLDAFLRGAALLAVRGNQLLGTQDDGSHYWRPDEGIFAKADFQRIFRSIGSRVSKGKASGLTAVSMIEDVMDVLAMVVPYSVSIAPSPDRLKPAALTLLSGSNSVRTTLVSSQSDLSTLLGLMLRMRLGTKTWGVNACSGSFDEVGSDVEILANSLASGVYSNTSEDKEQGFNAMARMPNIQLRFYQLWSAIFQPFSQDIQDPLEKTEGVRAYTLRAISLFAPRHIYASRSQPELKQSHLEFKLANPSTSANELISLTRLMDDLSAKPQPHFILCRDDTSSSNTVIGAYFPGPLWLQSTQNAAKRESKVNASHLLFQILPQFRLLEWAGPRIPSAQLFRADHDAYPDKQATEPNAWPGPYTIGVRQSDGTRLHIDPQTRTVRLDHSKSYETADCYTQIGCEIDQIAPQTWSATIVNATLEVFRMTIPMED